MVIWVTGLAGAGKTSLCKALIRLLKPSRPELVLLDGDVVRAAFGNDLGYGEQDRVRQIKRLQSLAKLLSDQGLIVMVAALYAHPDLLKWNRQHFNFYFEIYLKTSLETVRRRDVKGLYSQPADGEPMNVVGVDIHWHVPVLPDLVLDGDASESPEALARRVIAAIPGLAVTLKEV